MATNVRSGKRRKSRELALQMLFQQDMAKQTPEEVRKTFWGQRNNEVDDKTRGFADDLFRVANDRAREIDDIIQKHSREWRLERMAAIDRNLLRLAVAEFVGFPQMPRPIVISEAIELTHTFSASEAVKFVNAILDAISKDMGGGATKKQQQRG